MFFVPNHQVELIDMKKHMEVNEIKIGMPITALMRNINNLTSTGLFTLESNPRAYEMIHAVCNYLSDPVVLRMGHIHPITMFQARAVYASGCGNRGNKTWTPVTQIAESMLCATEKAFKSLAGLDMSVGFLMDASGSMSDIGSAPGMACLTALDIGVLLIMTLYRATVNHAETNGVPVPNHSIGFFGGSISTSSYRKVSQMIPHSDIVNRASDFKDVTYKFHPLISFDDAKKALGNGSHLGMTDIGTAFWSLILRLSVALDKVRARDPLYVNVTVFQLSGFAELLLLVTDNDVNSGDQPMDVLNLYWDLVRQAFVMLPFDKDGTRSDPMLLFNKYVPRLVVVATMGTMATIGDIRDSRVLNVSGFDASTPEIIQTFIRKG